MESGAGSVLKPKLVGEDRSIRAEVKLHGGEGEDIADFSYVI